MRRCLKAIVAVVFLSGVSAECQILRVACVGDSITIGGGANDANSYPSQLQRLLGGDYFVENFGHSGATLMRSGWLPYWNQPELKRSFQFRPDIVVILLGTNDSASQNWSKGADDFVSTCKELIKAYRDLPSKPVVYLGLPPPAWTDDGREQNMATGVRPLLRQAAREANVALIDLETPLNDLNLFPDRLHPNAKGYGILAEEVAFAIGKKGDYKKKWRVVYSDCEEAGEGPAVNAIDGNDKTYWHSRWSSNAKQFPHEIRVDMGSATVFSGFRYLARQDGGVNGRVKNFEFFISDDGTDWESPTARGELRNVRGWQSVRFPATVTARYFRFVALSEQNGGIWSSAAELDIIPAAR